MGLIEHEVQRNAFTVVAEFKSELYACLTARSDALFELCDALLCTDGPVRTLVDLALAPEHRRGHGALYSGINHGRIDVTRLRRGTDPCPASPSRWRPAGGRILPTVPHEEATWMTARSTATPVGRRSCSRLGSVRVRGRH